MISIMLAVGLGLFTSLFVLDRVACLGSVNWLTGGPSVAMVKCQVQCLRMQFCCTQFIECRVGDHPAYQESSAKNDCGTYKIGYFSKVGASQVPRLFDYLIH